MPTRGFPADLESGLPLRSGSRSNATVGCADFSWTALKCTLSVAEEAARQLHLCVAWVSEESQKDYDAWNAAKKDDDLFGPLRPASKQSQQDNAAAAPGIHADFSRNQLDNAQCTQQREELLNSPAALRCGSCASTPVWEDFRCSPTQLHYHTAADTAQQADVIGDALPVVNSIRLQGHGSAHHLNLPGRICILLLRPHVALLTPSAP